LNTSFVRKEKCSWNVYRFQGDKLFFLNANNLTNFNMKVISENRIFDKTLLCSFRTDSLPISCVVVKLVFYEGWNFNSGNYLFTTDTK